MTNNDPLGALRREIDRLDDALLDLIEQRFGAARRVADAKRSETDNRLRLRPAREVAVVDRLVAQAKDAPEKLVRQVWREIMACSLDLQVETALCLYAEQRAAALTDAMRRRFGCAARMIVAASPAEALASARKSEAIAVIELQTDADWWTELRNDPNLAIFDCLKDDEGKVIGLAVGRIAAEDLRACPQIRIVETAEGEGTQLAASGPLRLILAGDES